jgi:predicted helicase
MACVTLESSPIPSRPAYPIRVLDLPGNANIKETAPDGSKDENVFDIMQGVAVGLLIKRKDEPTKIPAGVFHCELWGSRASKYVWLLRNQQALHKWATLQPNSPHYFFVPRNESVRGEYESGWPLPKAMPVNGVGMVTARDALTIAFDSDALWRRVNQFSKVAADEARTEYNLGEDAQSWKVSWAQEDVRQSGPSKTLIQPVLYRPFDRRFTYYTGRSSGFICRPVFENMRHMLAGRNLSIDTCRQIVSDSWRHVLATDGLTDDCFVSNKSRERGYLFPVYLYPSSEVGTGQLFKEGTDQGAGKHSRRPNLSSSFVTDFGGKLGLAFVPDGEGDLIRTFGPEDIFHYAYAVFHGPGYRSRYAEFLKIDFPRLPLTSDLDLFRALAQLGGELVALHLLDSPKLDKPITEHIGSRNPEVEKVSWSKNTVWLDKAQTTGVKGVREDVWNFHIGGYQVCEKWLKDRKGRTLTKDDLTHYQKVVVALSQTIRLMQEIDQVIEAHGGWSLK